MRKLFVSPGFYFSRQNRKKDYGVNVFDKKDVCNLLVSVRNKNEMYNCIIEKMTWSNDTKMFS